MVEVTGVFFRRSGKVYYFSPNGLTIKKDDKVVVETARGIEIGTAAYGNRKVDEKTIVSQLKPVLRVATEKDIKTDEENRKREKEAFTICEGKIEKHKLDMKLIDVEYAFDSSKIVFFFTADGRVDFRELVKDLASAFRTRIELRQIGVRDESKMMGGLGLCGEPYCCSRFLNDFQPVSIKMAKEQGLSLNPTKISGACGRLMCCLKYEQAAYEDLIRTTPRVGAYVRTPKGNGTVTDVNLLRGKVKVRYEDESPESAPHEFPKAEVSVIRNSKNQHNEKPTEEVSEELSKLED